MLNDATYREWTDVFHPGSYYVGSWEQGSSIEFIGPDPDGKEDKSGMFAEIAENRLHEYVSIKQLGEVRNGVKQPWDSDAEVYENYTFTDENGGTMVAVELIGIPDEYMGMFDDMWPKALEKLKQITEQQV